MSRLTQVAGRVLATAGLVTAATLGLAAPAQAAPAVDGPYCESGNSRYFCDVWTSGPVQIQWYVNGVRRAAFDNRSTISGYCVAGSYNTVQVVITDTTGSSSATRKFVCWRGPWL